MSELVISWVVVGAAAGLLTFFFSRKHLPGGLLANLIVGIIGALAGGYVISDTTGTDIGRGAVTWGILIVAGITALVTSLVVQYESTRPPTKAPTSK